ncbi:MULTISPECIES: hypothetical protein [Vibrio]|uniref:Uncharacterized protein n=1 Tax=Vibrio parahaemolyticus TaxID=670 RepID=A0AAX0M828_VIBPH|nr:MULTISPECIES: hypothetical protein [Vibrio]EJG0766593.1 hypothetical protein [Vibrio parahaemolyticus O5:K30]MCS0327183.1 hypothetical protein [Vibrio diabolicus]ARN70099.1 hypothetical protein FORC36_5582 [Vibrio vulnificus]EGQ8302053.1 hypothetical protein [Vibrio parahaemolyticus]EGQ8891823.1 hypothetical protein [Vibrio parahaemolyticus]
MTTKVELKKVSMNLTQTDITNLEELKTTLNQRTEASVVSLSLALTKEFTDMILSGQRILTEDKDGKIQEIRIVGLVQNR